MDQQFEAAALLPDHDAPEPSAVDADETTQGDWFAMSRKALTHPIVGMDVKGPKAADPKRKAATPYEAWSFIIASAAFRRRVVTDRRSGATYQLDPGQLVASKRYLARKFNWSEKAALLFVKRLETADMLGVAKGPQKGARAGAHRGAHVANVLTVRNYGKYQSSSRSKGTTSGTKKGQQRNNEYNKTSLTLRDGRRSEGGFDVREEPNRQRIAKPSTDSQLRPWQNPEGLALQERALPGSVASYVRRTVLTYNGWHSPVLGPAPGIGEENAYFAYLTDDELARWAPKFDEVELVVVEPLPVNVVRFVPHARRELEGATL